MAYTNMDRLSVYMEEMYKSVSKDAACLSMPSVLCGTIIIIIISYSLQQIMTVSYTIL